MDTVVQDGVCVDNGVLLPDSPLPDHISEMLGNLLDFKYQPALPPFKGVAWLLLAVLFILSALGLFEEDDEHHHE